LFFPELGVQLAELLEVGYVTPRGGLSHTGVQGWCQGVVLPRHAEMAPFAISLVPHVKALSSWVLTLLVRVVVIGAVEEEVVACEQEL
jgi:hypothetical protein